MVDEFSKSSLESLGERLKARRVLKGLTLQELSDASGVHNSYIGRIERGERRPSASVLLQLAKPLGFAEAELLKMGGYLSPDGVDDRIARFKQEMKSQIETAMQDLMEKVDSI